MSTEKMNARLAETRRELAAAEAASAAANQRLLVLRAELAVWEEAVRLVEFTNGQPSATGRRQSRSNPSVGRPLTSNWRALFSRLATRPEYAWSVSEIYKIAAEVGISNQGTIRSGLLAHKEKYVINIRKGFYTTTEMALKEFGDRNTSEPHDILPDNLNSEKRRLADTSS